MDQASEFFEESTEELASPNPRALSLISYEAARRLGVLPLKITADGRLLAVALHPEDMLLADELRALCRMPVDLKRSPVPSLEEAIERAYQFSGALSRLAEKNREAPAAESVDHDDDSPAAEIVERIVAQALRERASDIHIEPDETKMLIRFRIDGRLITAMEMPFALHAAVTARIKIMAGMDIAKKRVPQDGRIRRKEGERFIDLRVATMPGICGEKTVLRILDREKTALDLDALGCAPEEAAAIRKLLRGRSGLILNTGPIGSGKTTTLHAMMRELNLDEFNAITIEDPVEYRIHGATQVQVNEKSGLSFAVALRSILRSDMDYLLLGEIRDAETASLAVRAAITGHLILATLHCGRAADAPARLADMGVPPYLLAGALRGVLSQRLVRRLCPSCRRRDVASETECRSLGLDPGTAVYRPTGCTQCHGRGYRGRIASFEIMNVTPEIAARVARGATAAEVQSLAQTGGMVPLRESLTRLVRDGITSCEEVLSCLGE